MSKILGISGKKQAGKNTTANYIAGSILKKLDMVQDFGITKGGELSVLTSYQDGTTNWGVFDINRKDEDFVEYAHHHMWPYVKLYGFADGLKSLCIEFFGLKPEQVYGTDNQKNTPTVIKHPDTGEIMTAREFMQYFGTDVMRKVYEPVHVNYTINRILSEQSDLAIVPDVRFPNEVRAIQDAGGKVIRLTRNARKDNHASECGLDKENFDWNNFDCIIENDGSIEDTIKSVDAAYQTIFLP
jgi:hypothetical protein